MPRNAKKTIFVWPDTGRFYLTPVYSVLLVQITYRTRSATSVKWVEFRICPDSDYLTFKSKVADLLPCDVMKHRIIDETVQGSLLSRAGTQFKIVDLFFSKLHRKGRTLKPSLKPFDDRNFLLGKYTLVAKRKNRINLE